MRTRPTLTAKEKASIAHYTPQERRMIMAGTRALHIIASACENDTKATVDVLAGLIDNIFCHIENTEARQQAVEWLLHKFASKHNLIVSKH